MSVLSRLTPMVQRACRPALPAILLAAAVAVSVAHGQPPPADRASGVSVPVRNAGDAPPGLGRLLVVSDGRLTSVDADTGAALPIRLPDGEAALRAWPLRDADVVLTQHVLPHTGSSAAKTGAKTPTATPTRTATSHEAPSPAPGRPLGTAPPAPQRPGGDGKHAPTTPSAEAAQVVTSAYVLPRRGAPIRLGPASAVVPTPDGEQVWLLQGDVARLVRTDGRSTGRWVRVPPNFWLVGAIRQGPVATVAKPEPMTVLLPADGGLPHWLANAEALDVADGWVLLRQTHRLGSLRLATGEVRWLPTLSAIEITGPGTLSPGGGSFAVQARVNNHARLVVGPIDARSDGELQVVALDGGRPLDHPPAPAWTEDDRVLAVRPDGRMVVFRRGDLTGLVLSAQFQADGLATLRPATPGHDLTAPRPR